MSAAERFIEGIALLHMTLPHFVMILVSLLLFYLAIHKKYEPLLLLPIAFGMLLANLPMPEALGLPGLSAHDEGGLLHILYQGIVVLLYPPLIFLCLGAMTDFGPLMSRPSSAFIGIGGQMGILSALAIAYFASPALAYVLPGFEPFTIQEAAAISIIGSSDGPTAIFISSVLASDLLPTIAIAAYSYMALVPIIQPPIMRLLTTQKERVIVMPEPKKISRKHRIMFPIALSIICILIVPAAGALIGMFMMGNLIRESGVVDRYIDTLQNAMVNILTILIGLSIGSTATAEKILDPRTIVVIVIGLLAFALGTVGGVLAAKILCKISGGKVNPLIGNAGVSAMPMAARVSQKVGLEYNPHNHLLMHAMGPIIASTIGSALLAGAFIAMFG
jgi:oxaloacetate decarboxylase beta subunit